MKKIVIATCVATLLILVLTTDSPFTGVSAQKSAYKYRPIDQSGEFVPGRVLAKFRAGIMPDHARNIIAALGARDADEIPGIAVHILELPYQADEAGFAQAMAQRPEVEFAELDRIVQPADVIPNDPWYAGWQWHLPKISAPSAWSTTTGGSSIVIAILDTGVDGSHQDLVNKLVSGWNVYNNNSDWSDVNGHGTNVAGVAGAQSNNGTGVAGVCWACKIMPIRISDTSGSATYSAMASGLTWAADHGARVANISYIASDSSTVRSAAQYFQNHGGVVTSSAGNYSTFDSSADNPYILTISAMDINDVFSSFSNYGNNVDLVAPEAGYTTARGNSYMYAGGTSFSSPVVAGVAGLILSVNPALTGPQVQDILKQNADDFGAVGWDIYFGWGRVNAERAVTAASGGTADTSPPMVNFTSPSNGATVSGNITVQLTASDNVGVAFLSLFVDGSSLGTDSGAPYGFSWDTTNASNGSHTLTAIAQDAAGNSGSYSITVMVGNSTPPADTTPPTETIISPSDGGRVVGNASVYVDAADNMGVVRNELYVDGVLVSASTTAPFTTKWNTRKAKAGSHSLQCKAYDAAGNLGASQVVIVYK
jgi:subtilisin family serine protease